MKQLQTQPSFSDIGQMDRFGNRLFRAFALLHFTVWLILPLLTKPNFPLDVIEGYIYGLEWAPASTKHPPLPAWVIAFLDLLTGRSPVVPYLAGQIFVFFAFWANWKLASAMLPAKKALLAVVLMEFYTYYTFYSLEFNNSVSLIGCWSLTCLAFYYALVLRKMRYWIATGVFLGLAVLAKYTGFLLVVFLLAFTAYEPKARASWKTPGPYWATLIAILLFVPHFLVVLRSDFATIDYIAQRVENTEINRIAHVLFPLRFALTQLGVIAPVLCGFSYFSGGMFRLRKREQTERFNTRFLVFLVLLPLVLQLLGSGLFAVKLSTIYGSHIWIFLGLFLVFFFEVRESRLTPARISVLALVAMACMSGVTVTRDIASPYWRNKPSRIHYPGREIARIAEREWHKRYAGPCPNLVGEWWLTGQVVAYGNDRPKVFCYVTPDFYGKTQVLGFWSDPRQAAQDGGICLWNENHYPEKVPPLLREEYPRAEILPTTEIPFASDADLPPLRLGIAVIPPEKRR